MISAIQSLENNELLRKKIRKNAFSTISKEHTWGNYVDAFIKIVHK